MNVYSIHGTGFDENGQRVKLCCRDVFVTKAEAESKLGWFAGVIKKEAGRHLIDVAQPIVVSVLEQTLVDRGWTLSVPPIRPDGTSTEWASWSKPGVEVKEWTVNVEDVPLKIRFADLSKFEGDFLGFKLELERTDAVQPARAEPEEGPVPPAGLQGPGGTPDRPPGPEGAVPEGHV